MSSVGMKMISSIITTGELQRFHKLRVDPATLKTVELEAWEYLSKFVGKHHALPKMGTVVNALDGLALPKALEVPSVYADQVQERYISESIVKGWKDTKEFLVQENMDTDKAVDILTETLVRINTVTHGNQVIDFRNIKDLIISEYKKKKNAGSESSILMGYPTVDEMAGGMVGGDVVSMVGRPAMGKTFNLLYSGHHAWNIQNKSVMVISMEMNIQAIGQRLVSMHTKKNLSHLKKAQLDTKKYKHMVTQLEGLKSYDAPMWLVDGNMNASVEQVWKLAQQFDPDLILIDGAYLLTHPNPRLNQFQRVAENTGLIKHALASDLDVPVMTSWQFNREAAKKMSKPKAQEKAGLEDIGYSDTIGQISSVVLGLMEHESVSTIKKRKINIMKGRNGEIGEFYINWDFFNMNFSEIIEGNYTVLDDYDKVDNAKDKKKLVIL